MQTANKALKIFINYRQADNRDFVRLLRAHLTQRYGPDNVFMDVVADNFIDMTQFFADKVKEHDALLCIIGPRWLELMQAKAEAGAEDYVLVELRTALANGIYIAPVLIKGARMPNVDAIPADIQPIFNTLAASLDSDNKLFEEAIAQMMDDLEKAMGVKKPAPNRLSIQQQQQSGSRVDKPIRAMPQKELLRRYYETLEDEDYENALVWLIRLKEAPGTLPSKFDVEQRESDLHALIREQDELRQRLALAEHLYEQLLVMAEFGEDVCDDMREIREIAPDFVDWKGIGEDCTQVKLSSEIRTDSTEAVLEAIDGPFEWMQIPAGTVTLEGSINETVEPFLLAKYCITNRQYDLFIDDAGYQEDAWWRFNDLSWDVQQSGLYPKRRAFDGEDDMPRVLTSWIEAIAFCMWLSDRTGLNITLPTEAQWQRAAEGDNGSLYLWGKAAATKHLANWGEHVGQPMVVNSYPDQERLSAYRLANMAGNIWEWTKTADYPDRKLFGDNISIALERIVKGGSYRSPARELTNQARRVLNPNYQDVDVGFRIACLLD